MNVVIEGCNEYDVVKAVTWKLLRISKNPALFWSFENKNYYIIEKKVLKILKQAAPVSVRITQTLHVKSFILVYVDILHIVNIVVADADQSADS